MHFAAKSLGYAVFMPREIRKQRMREVEELCEFGVCSTTLVSLLFIEVNYLLESCEKGADKGRRLGMNQAIARRKAEDQA